MSRFLHPSSVRYGSLENWPVLGEKVESNLECREFLKYLDFIVYRQLTVDFGTVIGISSIRYEKNCVKIAVPLYDRWLEFSLKEKLLNDFEDTPLYDRLLVVKKLLLLEGYKYFGVKVEIEFYFFGLCSMPSLMIARYIAGCLEENLPLSMLFRTVSDQLWGVKSGDSGGDVDGLSHRRSVSFSSDSNLYKPRLVGNRLLLGYRLDCVGRFSRKQRASKESRRIGSVSLGNFKGHVDYGCAVATMTYGVSNVRVWKCFDRYSDEWNYLLKVS